MDKIEYSIGLLKRLACCEINNKPYVKLDDAEYIIRNCGVLDTEEKSKIKPIEGTIMDILDVRPGKWPEYYDDCDAQDYQEYFIKGTNIKLGFKYINGETGEWNFYCIVCDGYDMMDSYEAEEELIEHFEWLLTTEHDSWRYYD